MARSRTTRTIATPVTETDRRIHKLRQLLDDTSQVRSQGIQKLMDEHGWSRARATAEYDLPL